MLEMVMAAIAIEMTTSTSVTPDEHRRLEQLALSMFICFSTLGSTRLLPRGLVSSVFSYAASRDRTVSISFPGAWGLGRKFKPSLRSKSCPTTCRL